MPLDEVFEEEAFGQRKIEDATFGYPAIVMGHPFIMEHELAEPERVPVFGHKRFNSLKESKQEKAKTKFIEEQKNKYLAAKSRVLGKYGEKLDQAPRLPIETRDEAIKTLEIDILKLQSKGLDRKIDEKIAEGISAEKIVYDHFQQGIQTNLQSGDEKAKTTAEDMKNMLMYYMHGFNNSRPLPSLDDAPDNCIPVCMTTIPPGEMTHFRREDGRATRMHAFIDGTGAAQSHTWILANGSRITAVRIEPEEIKNINSSDYVIIDALERTIYINPTPETKRKYREELERFRDMERELTTRAHRRTTGSDGRLRKSVRTDNNDSIKISATGGFSDEIYAAEYVNALTIGMYRTELAVLMRDDKDVISNTWDKDWEDRWYKIFDHLANEADGKAISLRTIDFAGDKILEQLSSFAGDSDEAKEKRDKMIRAQMRAALRVSRDNEKADFSMMQPMVKEPKDFQDFQSMMKRESQDLGIEELELGCMVETVSIISHIKDLKELGASYLSFGTNDLAAEIMDYDRYDAKEEKENYDPTNPEFLRQIREAVNNAYNAGYNDDLSICGNMANKPQHFALLIGLGFRHITPGVGTVHYMKELSRRINTQEAEELVDRLMVGDLTREQREKMLRKFNKKYLGVENGAIVSANHNRPPEGTFENILAVA